MSLVDAAGRRVLDGVRQFNKHVYNPVVRLFGGHRLYAVVNHMGRKSGRVYATPVMAYETENGFLIPLPYGSDTDWCKNVQAANGCTLRKGGVLYSTYDPQVIDAEAALDVLPAARRAALRTLHIGKFLRLTQAKDAACQQRNGVVEPGLV